MLVGRPLRSPGGIRSTGCNFSIGGLCHGKRAAVLRGGYKCGTPKGVAWMGSPFRRDRATNSLHIEVEVELVRVRPQIDLVYLLSLEFDPNVQHVLREDVTFEQEIMVFLERVQRIL